MDACGLFGRHHRRGTASAEEESSPRIAVINGSVPADKNADILKALKAGHETLNLGNTSAATRGSALHSHWVDVGLVVNLQAVDFVVGGCGTGLGYLNS
jgi:ribose 5-phosphate isomerase RpiB